MEKYNEILRWSRSFFNDVFLIAGIVTALTISGYFISRADIKYDINHRNTRYDDKSILRDFHKYSLKVPSALLIKLRPTTITMGKGKFEFSRDNPIKDSVPLPDSTRGLIIQIPELRDALKYKFREIIGSYGETGAGWIGNSEFWGTTFPDNLSGLLDSAIIDSISFYNAMKIILAHREVTVSISIDNAGSLIAKNIKIFLRRPFLLNPRSLMSVSKVEFVKIEPQTYETEIGDGTAKIKIDYLKPGDPPAIFYVTTSLTNITKTNIFIDYETDKTFKLGRIGLTFIIVLLFYYGIIPLVIRVFKYFFSK
jgi:hypothetical protein